MLRNDQLQQEKEWFYKNPTPARHIPLFIGGHILTVYYRYLKKQAIGVKAANLVPAVKAISLKTQN
jgi:hypothetical protein